MNSTVCTAIAGNSTAYGIMSAHYKSSMSSYIDSNFSDALNLLNYRCKAKCYLHRNGNKCTNITGDWNMQVASHSQNNGTWYFKLIPEDWEYNSFASTKSKINTNGYSKINVHVGEKENNQRFLYGTTSKNSSIEENSSTGWANKHSTQTTGTFSGTLSAGNYYITCYIWGAWAYVGNIWLTP